MMVMQGLEPAVFLRNFLFVVKVAFIHIENFHIGGNCGNCLAIFLLGNLAIDQIVSTNLILKDDPYILQSLIAIASNMKGCLRFFAFIP